MRKKIVIAVCLLATLSLTACSKKSTDSNSNPTANSAAATPTTKIDPAELTDTSKWKTVSSDSRFFKFTLQVPSTARTYFSPDTVLGTENGVFIGEDRFPYGLTVEYNTLNDRDAKTVTFKADYAKAKPSDIDFGLPNAVVAEGTNTRGINYTRYLVRKDDNLYILSIQTQKPEYVEAYKNVLRSLKIEK